MYRVKIITKDKKHIFICETKNIKLAETCYNTIERIMHDKNIVTNIEKIMWVVVSEE